MARDSVVEKENKKAGPFQWLVVIVIPIIFAITLALIILSFMGVDVIGNAKGFANHIPFLSSVVSTEEELIENNQLEELQTEIDSQSSQIDQLSSELSVKEQTIDELNQQVLKLEKQIEDYESGEQDKTETVTTITSSFKNMEPETAAPIISNLDNQLAASILESLPDRERGAILGALDPELAAQITQLLLE
ncbi:MotE family protein [Aquibacillus rhizosphaerae]|uniref:MotE family protein n=1 Tax=Aquibacillus rhizosphaerae TaxID=3051431 RepID=A0ABT7L3W0_9BACI|nr:MotE family protein [Aquibacillus sp. LR5S19]MDL4840064.1 MotE family protein [Aquibacillus sp. LR5S19]